MRPFNSRTGAAHFAAGSGPNVMLGACKLLHGNVHLHPEENAFIVARDPDGQMTNSYITSNEIPESGVYRVIHAQHRLPHEVTLIKGQTFPPCAKCHDEVRFELVRGLPELERERRGSVSLYSLPVLDDEEASAS